MAFNKHTFNYTRHPEVVNLFNASMDVDEGQKVWVPCADLSEARSKYLFWSRVLAAVVAQHDSNDGVSPYATIRLKRDERNEVHGIEIEDALGADEITYVVI